MFLMAIGTKSFGISTLRERSTLLVGTVIFVDVYTMCEVPPARLVNAQVYRLDAAGTETVHVPLAKLTTFLRGRGDPCVDACKACGARTTSAIDWCCTGA